VVVSEIVGKRGVKKREKQTRMREELSTKTGEREGEDEREEFASGGGQARHSKLFNDSGQEKKERMKKRVEIKRVRLGGRMRRGGFS